MTNSTELIVNYINVLQTGFNRSVMDESQRSLILCELIARMLHSGTISGNWPNLFQINRYLTERRLIMCFGAMVVLVSQSEVPGLVLICEQCYAATNLVI